MKSNTVVLVTALSLFAVGACAEEVEYTVEGHLAPCEGVGVQSCMLVDDGDGATFFYDGIRGFSFQWGVRQRLLVEIHEVDNPPADGSSRRYDLAQTIEQTDVAAGASFELSIRRDYLTASGDGFALPDGRQIECSDQAVCDDIGARMANDETFRVTLAHPSDPRDTSLPLEVSTVGDSL